jgi:hypothetical protein
LLKVRIIIAPVWIPPGIGLIGSLTDDEADHLFNNFDVGYLVQANDPGRTEGGTFRGTESTWITISIADRIF